MSQSSRKRSPNRLQFFLEEGRIIRESDNAHHHISLDYQLSQLLRKLLAHQNELVLKTDLITAVWQEQVAVGRAALPKNIWRLRKLFKDNHLEDDLHIETIPKRGYRLILNAPAPTPAYERRAWSVSRKGIIAAAAVIFLVFVLLSVHSIGEEIILLDG